ncbi:hypothetical protein BDR07DRAFT_307279 [Suillus spraguei]|nr:hypothetical protein BDR07DRAFT_307279 [Suillus spraguei]
MDITSSEAQEIMFGTYTLLAGNSILIYDHIATLQEEIAFIWRRPKMLSAILFLLNRYFALFCNISCLVLASVPLSDELFRIHTVQTIDLCSPSNRCLPYNYHSHLCSLWGSKRLLTCMTTIMVALAIAASVGSLGHFASDLLPGVGCYETYSEAVAARLGIAWAAEMVFELLIFILIVYRICKTRGLLRLSLVTRRNIVDIIFHNGVMYFGAMTLVNLPNILMFYSGSVATRGTLATLTSCLSVTLISRLMLNLHKSIDTGICSIPARDKGPSLAVFTTRINVQSAISCRFLECRGG